MLKKIDSLRLVRIVLGEEKEKKKKLDSDAGLSVYYLSPEMDGSE